MFHHNNRPTMTASTRNFFLQCSREVSELCHAEVTASRFIRVHGSLTISAQNLIKQLRAIRGVMRRLQQEIQSPHARVETIHATADKLAARAISVDIASHAFCNTLAQAGYTTEARTVAENTRRARTLAADARALRASVL